METPSLTRPPRSKRASEVARHVGQSMDAYRRMQAARKGKRRPEDATAARGRV
jgi:hypothetical protein